MFLSRLAPLLLLIPFVAAEGVHKLKLKKVQPTAQNPVLETAYLAEKYGGYSQVPMMGAGGSGRNIRLTRPTHNENGEELVYTQNEFNADGGHSVPLSSMWLVFIDAYPTHTLA